MRVIFFPSPRINLGKKLLENNLSKCAIDVSDGLLADLRHICEASKLDAEIYSQQIPLSKSAQKFFETNSKIKLTDLISGGDDYELIFAVNPRDRKKIEELSKYLKLDITCVGEFKKSADKNFQITLCGEKNTKINIKKFGHEH